MLEKNQVIELEITDFDYDGFGISHYDGYTIFVSNSLLGEVVKALVLKVSKTIAFAKTLEIIKESKNRIEPPCKHYKLCGGCNLMHLNYEEQIKVKEIAFGNTIHKLNKDVQIERTITNPNSFNYRNKVSLPFGLVNGKLVVGFYQKRSHNIVPVDDCLIERKVASVMIKELLNALNECGFSAFNELDNSGLLKHVVLRINSKDEIMLTLVVKENNKQLSELLKRIELPNVVSYYLNINEKNTNVILGDKFIHIKGEEYLIEELFDNKYIIHPNSFFQVNYECMKLLYGKAIELLEPKEEDVIIDAYCGIGTIGMSVARHVKEVIGIEVVKEAILNAKENAKNNHIDNISFVLGKAEEEIASLMKEYKITGLILDPPRKGSDEVFLNSIIENKIQKVVYISCGPQSLARDMRYLTEHGYKVKRVIPVDMFSQTSNLESVVLFSL